MENDSSYNVNEEEKHKYLRNVIEELKEIFEETYITREIKVQRIMIMAENRSL